MYLLDTNVLSELRKQERAHPNVQAWSRSVDAQDLYLSAVTILEIEAGVLSLARRDVKQAAVLRRWVDGFVLTAFVNRILPLDTEVARECARLHVPDRRPERDAMIAATAVVHRFVVVTRNVIDFQPMGVNLLNPWDRGPSSAS